MDLGGAVPRLVRTGLLLVAAVAWFVTAPAALWGASWDDHRSLVTPVFVFAVVIGAAAWRDRSYLRLPSGDRRRVDGAVRHGTRVDDPDLDAMAYERLQRAAIDAGSNRIARTVLAVAFVAVPVVAAVRVSPWFLLALPFVAVVPVDVFGELRREDPRIRLSRFLAVDGGR